MKTETKTLLIRGKDIEISDGYHTFDELYEHRVMLFLAWMLSGGAPGPCYYVEEHFEEWDLIVCEIAQNKQISYHVPASKRHLYENRFKSKAREDHKWDGHDSQDVLDRITKWITS